MNELEHLEEFQNVLADYHMSQEATEILGRTTLVLCNAISATGRNTIIRELLKTDQYHFIISDTTRQPRVNDGVLEQNGVEYWFRTEDDMLDDLKNGLFVEAAIIHNQQVSGMSVREVAKAEKAGRIGITDIEIAGVTSVMKVKPDSVCIFVLPPSFDEWQRRLNERGDMTDKEKHRRLESAVKELEGALSENYYRYVINDDLATAVAQIDAIATNPNEVDEDSQVKGQEVAQNILRRIRQTLGID